jgi:hypothetical protein
MSQAYAFHVLSVRINKIPSGNYSRAQAIGLLRASLQASLLFYKSTEFVLRECRLLWPLLSGIVFSWLSNVRSIRAEVQFCRGNTAVVSIISDMFQRFTRTGSQVTFLFRKVVKMNFADSSKILALDCLRLLRSSTFFERRYASFLLDAVGR